MIELRHYTISRVVEDMKRVSHYLFHFISYQELITPFGRNLPNATFFEGFVVGSCEE